MKKILNRLFRRTRIIVCPECETPYEVDYGDTAVYCEKCKKLIRNYNY